MQLIHNGVATKAGVACMVGRRRCWRRRGRGAAMIELVLVLPLLFVLLTLMFFFGRELVRMQHADSMNRYESWRQAEHATGPGGGGDELNVLFFLGEARDVSLASRSWFPPEPGQMVRTAAGQRSADAERLVDEMLVTLPGGRQVRTTTEHADSLRVWEELQGPIREQHVRLANHWRFVNGIEWDAGSEQWRAAEPGVTHDRLVEELFLYDGLSRPLEATDTQLARTLRNLYLHVPGYSGPEVPSP